MSAQVLLSGKALKQLQKLPDHIVKKFYTWVSSIQLAGLSETRKCKGYRDEALFGARAGQRSIRLNKSYRAIYIEKRHNQVELLEVIEVSNHEY